MDSGVAFDRKKIGHRNRTGDRDSRQIVAQQINNHQIFGTLFGVVRQAMRKGCVFRHIAAARRGALHRFGGDLASLQRKEKFG